MAPEAKILDRLRKLLALAKGATEHEAALAAERAAQLMAEHNIAEADLLTVEAKIVIDYADLTLSTKRIPWQGQLALGVAELVGGRHVWETGRVAGKRVTTLRIYGTRDAVVSAQYLFDAFRNTIEDLTEAAWAASRAQRLANVEHHNRRRALAGREPFDPDEVEYELSNAARRFKRGFRLGCAGRLAVRMRDAAAAKRGVGASEHALVVLGKIHDALDRLFGDIDALRNSRPSDGVAYLRGAAAANTIKLSADAVLTPGVAALPEKT